MKANTTRLKETRSNTFWAVAGIMVLLITMPTAYAGWFDGFGRVIISPKETIAFCSDSDGGENVTAGGFIRLVTRTGNRFQKKIFSDTCLNQDILLETICPAQGREYKIRHSCAGDGATCRNGACVFIPPDPCQNVRCGRNEQCVQGACEIINHPPILNSIGNREISENREISFEVTAEDADGDALEYRTSRLPEGATFQNQIFSWTPTFEQEGEYRIKFGVSDGSLSDGEQVTITVHNTNRPPVMRELEDVEVEEGEEISFHISAEDPDGDELEYSVESLPEGARFENQIFTWTPTLQQSGEYEVIFEVSDGLLQVRETVTVTVHDVNHPPVFENAEDIEVDSGDEVQIELHADDPDHDVLQFSADELPEGAELADGVFVWTPNRAGEYEITFIVSDGELEDRMTIIVRVNEVFREIGGMLQEDTVLTRENSPYLVTHNILVPEGVTLTIEPGVVVKFDGNYYIHIEGTFVADGTEDNRITFTSNRENPQPGDWDKIRFTDSSTDWDGNRGSVIRYTILEYSGGGGQPAPAAITMQGASPLIENNEVSHFQDAFIWAIPSSSVIRNNHIHDGVGQSYVIAINNGEIHSNVIENNGGIRLTGIACSEGSATIINNRVVHNSGDGIVSYSCSGLIQNNIASDNQRRGLVVQNGRVTVANNIIEGNTDIGAELSGVGGNIFFNNNVVRGSERGVQVSESRNSNTPSPLGSFEGNTISENQYGLFIFLNTPLEFHGNNILNNIDYSVYIRRPNDRQSHDINGDGNWWGTTDADEIAEAIYDWNDDFLLPRVIFEPFAAEPFVNEEE